jgi:hypothetical protein
LNLALGLAAQPDQQERIFFDKRLHPDVGNSGK